MADLPPPPPRPRQPPPRAGKNNVGRVWHAPRPTIIPHPLGPFPLPGPVPGYGWMNPPPLPPTGFGPYAPRPGFFGARPYGFGHPCVPPAQPPPKVNVNVNAFVENISKVDNQTIGFAFVRRGTGVYIPVPIPSYGCNRPGKNNRGTGRKQNEEGAWRSTRNFSRENDGLVKQEECPQTPSSEIGLPKEWTY